MVLKLLLVICGYGGVQKNRADLRISLQLQEYIVVQRLFQPLLCMLARCGRNQLIRQIEFMKAENEMLRKRIPTK
jgi:hypothetical protein